MFNGITITAFTVIATPFCTQISDYMISTFQETTIDNKKFQSMLKDCGRGDRIGTKFIIVVDALNRLNIMGRMLKVIDTVLIWRTGHNIIANL